MEFRLSKEKRINSIWLSDDKKPEIINKSQVIITDKKLFEEVTSTLIDFPNGTFIDCCKSSRIEAYRLITGNLRFEAESLLYLFKTRGPEGHTKDNCLQEFKNARQMLQLVEMGLLDIETVKRIINQVWPNFAAYAFEGLRCTDIEIIQKYDVEELQAIVEKNKNAEITREAKAILANRELAQSNGKVLSLARHAHRLGNSSR